MLVTVLDCQRAGDGLLGSPGVGLPVGRFVGLTFE